MHLIYSFFYALWDLSKAMAPYLFLGFIFAGILSVYFPVSFVSKHLGKNNFLSIIKASVFGIPLPLCSCGVLPVAASLKESGASDAATVSFLITTPVTGIDSLTATWAILGWFFTFARLISSFIIGIIAGFLSIVTSSFFKNTKNPQDSINNITLSGNCADGSCTVPSPSLGFKESVKSVFHYAFIELPSTMSSSMLIGLLVAAVITVAIPQNLFANYMSGGYWGILMAMLLATPLYICATGSIPVVVALLLKGISPGAAIAFMIAGPATNAVAINTVRSILGMRNLLVYLISIGLGAFITGIIVDKILIYTSINYSITQIHQHSESTFIYSILGAILLFLLIFNYIDSKFSLQNKFYKLIKKGRLSMNSITLQIPDMTCAHCKMTIQKTLKEYPSITETTIDVQTKIVEIYGDPQKIDLEAIIKKLSEIGYPPIVKKL